MGTGSKCLSVAYLLLICDTPGLSVRGASWGSDGNIIFATIGPGGLFRVPYTGGEPEELTTPASAEEDHLWPEILPGGDAIIFSIMGESADNARIALLSLASGEIRVLVPGGSNPRYTTTGHIVYGVSGTLRAVGFDLDRLEVTSDPVPVLDGVVTKASGAADFGMSLGGTLVYGSGAPTEEGTRTLVWVDRNGHETPLIEEPGPYLDVDISPDGTRVAVSTVSLDRAIWVYDLEGAGGRSRLTTHGGVHPVWTADGARVVFDVDLFGDGLYWIAADGVSEAQRLFTLDPDHEDRRDYRPDSMSSDGVLAFSYGQGAALDRGRDIWVLPQDGEPVPFVATPFSEDGAMFSPDGRWIAYVSDESGRQEVYVQPYPGPGRKYPISIDGGRGPSWSGKGDEIFYRSLDANRMMVVPIDHEPEFRPGTPEILFEGAYLAVSPGDTHYDVTHDGQRFLMVKPVDARGNFAVDLILIQNWSEELKRLVPTQ